MKTAQDSLHEDFLLRFISDGTSSETGSQFFRALVKNLSQAVGTYGAWVTEYLPEVVRLRALAFWLGGEYVEHYEYDITGTPCSKFLRQGPPPKYSVSTLNAGDFCGAFLCSNLQKR